MTGFTLRTSNNILIRFSYYTADAPATCTAFHALLPFTRTFMHARVSGQEIWTDDAPAIDVIQENASVFTNPGEVVYGPHKPARVKTKDAMGIYYGEGRGLDAANIFAVVFAEDLQLLQQLGHDIWKAGVQPLHFDKLH